ncbi:MAG: twin-arginine translocation signal domain-containing protein [Rhodospirillaceae bacterium]|nr:twin-arginine translocation signal domain-containing protein [Rhodospirillaceae bacterium]
MKNRAEAGCAKSQGALLELVRPPDPAGAPLAHALCRLALRRLTPFVQGGCPHERSFRDPFDSESSLPSACSCGGHSTQAEHDRATLEAARGTDELCARVAESAVVRAICGDEQTRRNFLRAVGAGTALAAIAEFFPLDLAREAAAQTPGPIEKKNLQIGFIPITCATPIIMAHPMGFYAKHGLDAEVIKTSGWAVIRDKSLNKEYDAAHMLSPMPLAITIGAGSNAIPWTVPAIENINGQAITLSIRHKDKRDPKGWKGMKFAVPFDFSMHNYLLRYYLAENGLDPDRDVQIRAVPPAEMVANLRADNIDGFLGPDPFNQRAVYDGVGFIHLLSRELWDGHPCCAFSASREFTEKMPNTFLALLRSIVEATAFASKPENRKQIAEAIAPANYLNQPITVIEQILTGTFADGLGSVRREPNRIDFNPFPWHSMAIWILTQMKRWGQIKGDVDYAKIAHQVFLATDARKIMREMGLPAPVTDSMKFNVMGKEFDPATPERYLETFAIKRS